MCLNARSIINKKTELNIMVDDIKPHIIGITESWANNDITDAELGLEGYVMFRKNRMGRKVKVKVWFYIALYPVRWTAQSALHFPPLADLFIPTPFSASLGSILAMQQLRNDYSLTFPPLSIARYSFIQLSRLRRREVKENAQTSKR